MKDINDNLHLAPVILGKLLNIGGMLQRQGNKLLLSFDLNQQQFTIFYEIAKAGKVKQKEMVNRLMLERAHVSKVVKKLQKMELITISTSDDDKRSAWLEPTEKGEQLLKSCLNVFGEWNREWFGAIDHEQLSSILENLQLLQDIFKEKIK